MEYLNFQEISKVPFKAILNHLNIPYKEENKELKGQDFIVNTTSNLYFNQLGTDRGSVINFLAKQKNLDLRSAASEIKALFIDKAKPAEKAPAKLPDYPFLYHEWFKDHQIAEEEAKAFEMTYCKKGILAGKIAIAIRTGTGEKVGYIGRNLDDGYFYPKQFNAGDYLYNLNNITGTACILVSDPFKAIEYAKRGQLNAISLLSPNLSDAQANLLKRFQFIEVDHPKPENIILRLSKIAFVKQI